MYFYFKPTTNPKNQQKEVDLNQEVGLNQKVVKEEIETTTTKDQMDRLIQKTDRLNELIPKLTNKELDWKVFIEEYKTLDPTFFESIKANTNIPNTTHTLKHLICIKLRYTNKETAQILDASIESVKTYRYRLKKRLGLTKEQSLFDYVDAMSLL